MKKITLLLCLFIGLHAFSQENESDKKDSTRLVIGNKVYKIYHKKGAIDKIEVEEKEKEKEKEKDSISKSKEEKKIEERDFKKFGHWGGMDFGFTSLLNMNQSASFPTQSFLENDPSKSFYVSLNLIEHKFPIIGNYVGITTGLGFDWTKIGFKNNMQLNYNADSVWTVKETKYTYDRNFLRATYVDLPLYIEFNTSANPKKSWHFMFGMIAGMKIGSKFIQTLQDQKNKIDNRVSGDYALNPYKLQTSVRIGYKHMGIFTNYSLIPMFDSKRVEKAYPVTFGISWIW